MKKFNNIQDVCDYFKLADLPALNDCLKTGGLHVSAVTRTLPTRLVTETWTAEFKKTWFYIVVHHARRVGRGGLLAPSDLPAHVRQVLDIVDPTNGKTRMTFAQFNALAVGGNITKVSRRGPLTTYVTLRLQRQDTERREGLLLEGDGASSFLPFPITKDVLDADMCQLRWTQV